MDIPQHVSSVPKSDQSLANAITGSDNSKRHRLTFLAFIMSIIFHLLQFMRLPLQDAPLYRKSIKKPLLLGLA